MADGAEHLLQNQLGESDDGVQRGAQLMAHGGQEVALRAVGHLRGFLGAQQFVLGLLALRHVAERPGHAVDMAARVAQAEAARVDPAVGAVVAAPAVHVVIVVGVAAQVLTHTLTHFLDVVGMNAREPQVGWDHRLAALEAGDLAQAARYVDAAYLVAPFPDRVEEHPSELQYLMRTTYAAFSLNKKTTH